MPPKKQRGPLTDEEKFQVELLQEKELSKLRRQCTLNEQNRSRYLDSKQNKTSRDDKMTAILEHELEEVRKNLRVATTTEKTVDDQKTLNHLNVMLTEFNEYDTRGEISKRQIKELEGQIKMVKKRVLNLRAQQTTDRQHEDRIKYAQITLEKLENALDLQVKKFCSICWKNRILREEIQHLLQIRRSFMVIWDSLIENMAKGKQVLLDLIESATLAFDEREEWCMKLKALKIKAFQDYSRNALNLNHLDRMNDDKVKLQDFFYTKGQIRNMQMLRHKERLQRLRKQSELEALFAKYKQYWLDIRQFMHEEDVGIIATNFYRREAENFTNFKYINDLTKEMESTGYELGQLQIAIDLQRLRNQSYVDRQSTNLREIGETLSEHTKERTEVEENLKQINGALNQMMAGIQSVFRICKCKNDPLIKLLGGNNVITIFNVLLYLQILEQNVHTNLLKACFIDNHQPVGTTTGHSKKKSEHHVFDAAANAKKIIPEELEPPTIYSIDAIVDYQPCPLCVERDFVTDVIEKLQCVWSKETIRRKLAERMKAPEGPNTLHRVSKCMLPKARAIIQRRLYQ